MFNSTVHVVLLSQRHGIAPEENDFQQLAEAAADDQKNRVPVAVVGDYLPCRIGR